MCLGAMTEAGAQEPATGNSPTIADQELRFSDDVLVAMDDDRILIGNRNTGAYRIWPRSEEERLNRYTTWCAFTDVISETISEDEEQVELNAELDLLAALLELDVLDDRSNDLSGARLPGPGAGWDTAMQFLLSTRTTRETIFAIPEDYNMALAQKARLQRQPSAYYERAGTPLHPLPDPLAVQTDDVVPFQDVLLKRRTTRRFSQTPVTEAQLSAILYYGWGATNSVPNPLGDVFLRKTSPSGGALHPIEIYPVVMNVEGVPQGLYHYSVRHHALEEISLQDPTEWVAEASGDQEWVAEAGVVFLCTAFLPRTAWKYNYSRVARAVISEVGYSGQSAFLTATWLGLGAFTTIALRDQIWEEKLGLDPLREPVFAITGAGQLEPDIDDHARPRKESALGVETS